jgi:hypothetical protein
MLPVQLPQTRRSREPSREASNFDRASTASNVSNAPVRLAKMMGERDDCAVPGTWRPQLAPRDYHRLAHDAGEERSDESER